MSRDSNPPPINIADPFARGLLTRYLERRKTDIEQLRNALASKNYATIERTGHNLFGSGAAYGLDAISTLGADLERAAQDSNDEAIASLVEELEEFVKTVAIA
ncbi:MAG: Hpt domain-containing protein [Gammaproteobacteria bacterium]|nr:Hpt domain-containing protein [Gammaproteobacteria bacterium]NNF48364.1 Hpt domain-containing protein [Woeseiaceae bacterium]MBT8093603.1 Hpt domain-containing protein [Gammaproteobacteria bacterium]MBT8104300.1 Hpt domain-containing protein [Gammaproteobacteria bacterium]NNK24315.1 Hpt domain-containing protein [Woeseiaceae bacterium]